MQSSQKQGTPHVRVPQSSWRLIDIAQCDGKQPVCTRCQAYGYSCTWLSGKRRGPPPRTNPVAEQSNSVAGLGPSSAGADSETLRAAIQSYDELALQLRSRLTEPNRDIVDAALARIRIGLPHDLFERRDTRHTSPTTSDHSQSPTEDTQERYLGAPSDVRFFNSVRDLFLDDPATPPPGKLESYEVDTKTIDESLPPIMPSREECDAYVDWWFDDFNKSYAIMCQTTFRRDYAQFWENQSSRGLTRCFLPTLRKSDALNLRLEELGRCRLKAPLR